MHDIVSHTWSDLTSRQRSIWLDIAASGNDCLFQVGAYARIPQQIDLEVLQEAAMDVVSRHDAFRLTVDADQPRQRFAILPTVDVQLIDFSDKMTPNDAILEYVDQLFASPFPLGNRALFQFVLARAGKCDNLLILRMHHLVTDAVAISLAFKDVLWTYESLKAGVRTSRPTSSYLSFMKKDALYLNSPRYKRDLDYWRDRLRDLPEPLFSKALRDKSTLDRSLLVRELSFDRFKAFKAQCAAQNIRPTNAIMALGAWLLGSSGGKNEIVLGVAYPGRTKEEQETIGMFSGVMPLRVKLPSVSTLAELAKSVTQLISRDYLHYRTPIDDIRRSILPERRHRARLVDVMISYAPLDVIDFDVDLGGKKIIGFPLRGAEANPLAIYILELHKDAPIGLELAFDRTYLHDHQVAVLADNFELLLDQFIEHPDGIMLPVPKLTDAGKSVSGTAEISDLRESAEVDCAYDIQIVSTFTADPIAGPLQFWLQRVGITAKIEFAGYNQVFQELLASTGQMRLNRHGANIILLRLEDWFRQRSPENSLEQETDFPEKVCDEFLIALKGAVNNFHAPSILLVCAPSPEWDKGGPYADMHHRVEQKLVAGLRQVTKLQVVTYHEVRDLLPITNEYDATGDELGHIPYLTGAFTAMATLMARRIHLAIRSPIKVIVADCDNTLWDGVVGEDGATGVVISESHRRLQARLVSAAKSGVLVCLVSKNIEEDVTTVFDEREDMLLKREHIVGYKINWKPKSENIKDLARELNLGLDSFLFLDDNPIEVAEVAANCPLVTGVVMTMSGSAKMQPDHLWLLDSLTTTAEDSLRLESYRSNLSRKRELESAVSFASFIEGLQLQIAIEVPNEDNLPRLVQLTERTNQFNINNMKRSSAELSEQSADANSEVLAFRVSDKFGDYGIVGLLSVRSHGKDLIVDTFLMSCRVLGRGVEHRMISEIGRLAVKFGASNVKIPVLVTARNLPVRRFLDGIGGQCAVDEQCQLYRVSSEVAETCRFLPVHDVEHSEDVVDRNFVQNALKNVGGEIWSENATTLTTVVDIEKAVRSFVMERHTSKRAFRPAQTQTEKVLEELFSQALGLDTVGADDDFFDLGVHSLMAVQLVSRMRERFNFQMSIRALFECSTIAELARSLEQQRSSGYQPLVPLQQGDRGPALFCCHPANGDAVCYMRLAKAIGPDQTIFGFEASGISPGETMAKSIPEMASAYVSEMIAVQPKGPYHLLGWSFGCALAFEMARQILEAGKEVGFVGFLDGMAPENGEPPPPYRFADEPTPEDEAKLLDHIEAEMNTIRRNLRLPALATQGRRMTWEEVIAAFHRIGVVPADYSIEEMRRKCFVYGNCALLFEQYRPEILPIRIVHFRASQNLRDWDFDWGRFTTRGAQTIWIRCNHYRMGFEPNTTVIAAHLRSYLRGEKFTLKWWQLIRFRNWINDAFQFFLLKRA